MMTQEANPLRHVAIIMDGNNRWARDRDLPPLSGHQAGADRLKEIVESCQEWNVEVLTVFAFSSENWRRPKQEVEGLMSLFSSSLKRYRKHLVENNIRLRVVGRRDRFSDRLRKLICEVEQVTESGARTLVIAADYGGRWDITEATRAIAAKVVSGELALDDINEAELDSHMCVADLSPPDLLIRTGSEYRLSNFLLWQLAYTELYFANCYWPDFDKIWFAKALKEYSRRQRRFGSNPLSEDAGTLQNEQPQSQLAQ